METEIISLIIALVVGVAGMGGFWLKGKKYIKALREIIVALDDAMDDDKISEEEWQDIWSKLIKITMLHRPAKSGE